MNKRSWIHLVAGAVAAAVVVNVVLRADLASTWEAMRGAGPYVLAAPVPFALGMAFDAAGMVALLRALGHRTTLAEIFPVRLASEALHITLPAGFVAADAATAVLLDRRCAVPVRDGVVASIARKWLVMRSHALYIVVGGAAGFAALVSVAAALHVRGLPWMVLASSLLPLALSVAVGAGLLGGSPFAKLHAVLARIPSARLARWLASRQHDAVATDAQVQRLRSASGATTLATAAFLATWCCEALESALLLRLVGARVDLPSVFAVEAGLSLVRSVAAVAPAGLGVVDLGYATVVAVLGVPPGACAAFVVLRRAKEVVWVALGYSILTVLRRVPADVVVPESTPQPSALPANVEYVG